jgi:hypothetical protein
MFLLSFGVMVITYFIFLPFPNIINILLNEYIAIFVMIVLLIIYSIYKQKLANKVLYKFIDNLDQMPMRQTLIIFILFQCYDFYTEQSFVGMISLWFMYWIYGICANLIMNIINLHQNYNAYKKVEMI